MVKINFRKLPKIDKLSIYVSFSLRFILLLAIAQVTWQQQWLNVFLSSLVFILTFIPSLVAKNIKVNLPTEFELIGILFIFASLFLGDLQNYYVHFRWWDVILHALSGLIFGFVGFLIMYILHDRHKIQASPAIIAIFSFCFAMAIGAVWEIIEFSIDSIFGTHMQRSGLMDTMWDLILDASGALIMAVAGYFYVKGKPSLVIKPALKHFIKKNKHLYDNEDYDNEK